MQKYKPEDHQIDADPSPLKAGIKSVLYIIYMIAAILAVIGVFAFLVNMRSFIE